MLNKEIIINTKDLKQPKNKQGHYPATELIRFKNKFVFDFFSSQFGKVNMIDSDDVNQMTQIKRHLSSSHERAIQILNELANHLEAVSSNHIEYKINLDISYNIKDLIDNLDTQEEKIAYELILNY